MIYPVNSIANAMLEIAEQKNIQITPLKMQKLLYFAQAWYYKLNRTKLFESDFYKWSYGPVIPSLYNELRQYGSHPITNKLIDFDDVHDENIKAFIDNILDVYGKYDAFQLSYMTHMDGTAWSKAFDDSIINLADMALEVGD